MANLGQNVRFAVRQLKRNPGFMVTVVFTLALSIGANTAVFSVMNALLLKSLPYQQPERIGTIFTRIRGSFSSEERHHINGEQWELLRDNVPSLISAVLGGSRIGVNLQADSGAQYVHAGRVSAHYFDVLGIHPMIGRSFSETEDQPHAAKTAVLSYTVWRNTFNSDANISGKSILLRGEPYTVVGVLAEGATTPLNSDLYTPLQASREGEGGGTNFDVIVRLRKGATWQQADAEINRTWLQRAGRYELEDNPSAQVSYYTVPLKKGETFALRPQILALMMAAGLILLIACANLAGLTLVRMLRRTPEVATRMALGASRWQIQRQFWTEALLLAFLGGVAGVGVGFFALRGVLRLLPEHFLPVGAVTLDRNALIFTAAISLTTSVLFGMLPALTMRRFDLRSAIASRTFGGANQLRLRQSLIVAEVGLTVVLLAGAGLLIRTLIHLQTLPAGFDATGVMTAKASLDDARFHDGAAFRKLLAASTAAMRQIPGVQYAAVGLSVPFERTLNDGITLRDSKDAGRQVMTSETYVTPDYFAALQIPILKGRAFTDADTADSQRVAIVNRTFMHKFFHGEDPVGHYVNKDTLIVGMAEDVAIQPGLNATAPLSSEEGMYIPATQVDPRFLSLLHIWFQPSWIVRTAGPVEGLTGQMQRALASVDSSLPFSGFYRMSDLMARTLAMQRIEVSLLSTMAALALLLSTVGIFALVANLVAQKTHEIGIRMALGSTIREAMVNVGAPGLRAAGLGLVLGLLACTGTLRMMRSVLYGVGFYDYPTVLAVVAMLVSVTLIAVALPTLRIARIDPAETLREE
jgi:macrolide transport system ATP-binding/permease protein